MSAAIIAADITTIVEVADDLTSPSHHSLLSQSSPPPVLNHPQRSRGVRLRYRSRVGHGARIARLKIIDPLTNPTAHGASASDAFHVVIPSMAGYGFSGKPTTPGWDPARMARAWVELMKRVGYNRFAAQGGDWGGLVTNLMAQQASPELIGIHLNFSGAPP